VPQLAAMPEFVRANDLGDPPPPGLRTLSVDPKTARWWGYTPGERRAHHPGASLN
jgi:hypothetical protein